MKNEDIYDGITDIRDELIDAAEKKPKNSKSHPRKWWMGAVAAVLVVAVISGAVLWPGGNSLLTSAYAIAEAQYPEMQPYPDESEYIKANGDIDEEFYEAYEAWWDSVQAQWREDGYADGLEAFFAASARQFLSDTGTENRVYSPLNVYMALGMLAELTDGGSRQQVLELLGSESIEALREQASDLWNASYRQDGIVSSVLASSLWLREDVEYVQATMDRLAGTYYASSYRGEMGSDEYNRALQDWLNEQTGGLLKEQASQIEMNSRTVIALATTVFFQAKWSNEFREKNTQPGTFHAAAGDVSCDFMYQSISKNYYWGDKFSAVAQRLENGGSMWFILPDEGLSMEELLADGQTMDFILADGDWENSKHLIVNQYIPKFDVTSQLDLIEGLKALGVTDVFDPLLSDFSPTTTEVDELYLSRAQHDARVTIDEEGCTAVAYTVMMGDTGAPVPPEEEVDFRLDRPFIFVITNDDGLPLFIGVVNDPA